MTRAVLAAVLFMFAVATALATGWTVSGVVEQKTAARAERVAAAAGHDWLRVSADGLRLTLSGAAPDELAAEAARKALEAAKGPAIFDDRIAVARRAPEPSQAATAEAEPPRLVALRDAKGVTLAGRAPDPATRDRIAEALREASPDRSVVVVAEAGDSPGSGEWGALASAAAQAVSALDFGRVEIAPEGLSVSGLPLPNREARFAEIGERLRSAGFALRLDLAEPRPPLSASVFEVRADAEGRLAVEACSAPDAAAAEALEAAASAHEASLSRRCLAAATTGSSEASLGWARLAEAGMDALREIGGGAFRIENGRATLSPPRHADETQVAAALEAARAAAPGGVRLALAPPAALPSPPERSAEPGVWLRARLTPELLTLTGSAPDEPTRAAVRSYAAAAFGAERVHEGIGLSSAEGAASGWRAATLAAIDALDRLKSGEAVVHGGRIAVDGVADSAASAGAAHRAIETVEGWRGESRIAVDLPGRAAATKLSPTRCVETLDALVAETPIVFAPSSAEIDVESEAVLEALALTLGRCGGEPIEIGGHTDSQGSESYNRRLSRERAEAVRQALIGRGAPPERLVARGYGEDDPVADNATEEGRALNRRIAFTTLAEVERADAETPEAPQ